jgi:hypothetical protein
MTAGLTFEVDLSTWLLLQQLVDMRAYGLQDRGSHAVVVFLTFVRAPNASGLEALSGKVNFLRKGVLWRRQLLDIELSPLLVLPLKVEGVDFNREVTLRAVVVLNTRRLWLHGRVGLCRVNLTQTFRQESEALKHGRDRGTTMATRLMSGRFSIRQEAERELHD